MSTEALPIVEWILPVGRQAAAVPPAGPARPDRERPAAVWGDPVARPAAIPASPADVQALPALEFDEGDLARACAASARAALRIARDEHAAAIAREDRLVVERLQQALARAEDGFRSQLAGLAAGLTRAFTAAVEASGLLKAGRGERLEAMLRSTLAETLSAPSLRLTLAPGLASTMCGPLSEALAASGLGGRVELAAGPLPDRLSLRVDWQDGWAEGDLDHVERLLIEHLTTEAAAMAASAAAPPAPEDDP